MASSSSPPRRLGNISNETDSLPPEGLEQLPIGGFDVFLSYSDAQKGFAKGLFNTLSHPYKVFFDIARPSLPLGDPFPPHIHAATTCKVALVVLSDEFFCSEWPMLELSAFFEAGVKVLPLFYELSPKDLSDEKKFQRWHERWKELASKDGRINMSLWADARRKLSSTNGLIFKKLDGERAYLKEVMLAIYQLIPPPVRSAPDTVCGRDRLCKALFDKFEELEQRPQKSYANLHKVCLLGVYGLPGSGKSTLCACLRDQFFDSFAGRALHLKLHTNPTPRELLGIAKKLLRLTDFGHNREKMISEIEEFSEMYGILEASNLRSTRVFLVIDNISSQESIELVEAILKLGVGAGSRVMLVARTRGILSPLLNISCNPNSRIHYVRGSMAVPSLDEIEANCLLMQCAGGPSHGGVLAKVARMCTFRNQWHGDLLYLPLALKIIGSQLRINGDIYRQLSKLDAITGDLKEFALEKIVMESYKNLSKKLQCLFLDVALFMVPYCQFRMKEDDESAVELLGFMHDCRPETIKRELNDLKRLCFLESGFRCDVHDVFVEFAQSRRDVSSMYYCRRRNTVGLQVWSDLSKMERLRAVILEVDEKCERFDFPPGLLRVKVVIVRQCKSLEVLGLEGLMSLISLEIEDCPRLRHLKFDPCHAYTLKKVRCVREKWGDYIDVAHYQQQGSFQNRLLQMLQAGSDLPAKQSENKVCCSTLALGEWHLSPPLNGFMNLSSQLKVLQVLSLERTGITSLGELSNCWPRLRVLEIFEGNLEVLELGNLPNLKQFRYGDTYRDDVISVYSSTSQTRSDPKMLRKPKLLAGCPELEDVRISEPSYEDGMGSLILPPKIRTLQLKCIYDGEPLHLEFSSSAHLLEKISVFDHWVLQSLGFTCQFLRLVEIFLELCDNLVTITGLEWLPMLRRLTAMRCAKLQSLGNLEALRMLERLELGHCPVLTVSSRALSSQCLATISVRFCPNVQFLASDLENLTALSFLRCNVLGNMFKLKNLAKLEEMSLEWVCEGQADNAARLCSYDEANCEHADGDITQVQGFKYMPLLVVEESMAPPLSILTLCGVQSLASLDGIHCFCMLRKLRLMDLPKLTCLQGLESLVDLDQLYISHCPAVKELPSLCSLVKVTHLSITHCVNLILVEGLYNMWSLKFADFSGCVSLEMLEWGLDILEHLCDHSGLRFRGCKFASIQAMVTWVLDEEVSKVVLGACVDALTWELTDNLLEKPRERMALAEKLVVTLGYFLSKHTVFTDGDYCFDFQPWVDELKLAWRAVCGSAEAEVSFPRGLEERMQKLGRVPLEELLIQCQYDEDFCASAATCIIEAHPKVLSEWISFLVLRILPIQWGSFSLRVDMHGDLLFPPN